MSLGLPDMALFCFLLHVNFNLGTLKSHSETDWYLSNISESHNKNREKESWAL